MESKRTAALRHFSYYLQGQVIAGRQFYQEAAFLWLPPLGKEGTMTKAVTHSLISIAIFGVMQTSSVAQDCYFNNITFQPPNPALCSLQQSVPSPQTSSIRQHGRQRRHPHARH